MESFKKEAKKDLEHKEICLFLTSSPQNGKYIFIYVHNQKRDILK